jgi:hypothetical protein
MDLSNIDFSKINLKDPDNLNMRYIYPSFLLNASEKEKSEWTHKQEQLGIINRLVDKIATKEHNENYQALRDQIFVDVLLAILNGSNK